MFTHVACIYAFTYGCILLVTKGYVKIGGCVDRG